MIPILITAVITIVAVFSGPTATVPLQAVDCTNSSATVCLDVMQAPQTSTVTLQSANVGEQLQ
jgi:hypothetical protein